jgi:hypothetical protein
MVTRRTRNAENPVRFRVLASRGQGMHAAYMLHFGHSYIRERSGEQTDLGTEKVMGP